MKRSTFPDWYYVGNTMLAIPDCESPQRSAVSGLSSTEKETNVVKHLPWISCFPDDAQSPTENEKQQRRRSDSLD